MDWLQLLLSALVAAVVGPMASIATSSRIARGAELGRVQEEARQRILATVREWRGQVMADRVDATWAAAIGSEYLTRDRGLTFAEAIEKQLVHAPRRVTVNIRRHITVLVGPVDAHVARELNPIPLDDRNEYWRTVSFLQASTEVGTDAREEHGLLGQARDAPLVGQHVHDIVAELDQMDVTLRKWRAGLRGR